MKPILLLILFFPMAVLSQTFAVENKHNYVYKGVYNPLHIVVQGYPSSAIRVNATNGTVRKDEHGSYNLVPDTLGVVSIIIKVKTKNGLKKIGERYFRVKKLPTPEAFIGALTDGEATTKILLAMGGLRLLVGNDEWECRSAYVKVVSYKTLATRGDSVLFFTKNEGPGFSEKLREKILSLQPDDRLTFMEIIGYYENGEIIDPPPLPIQFTIKDSVISRAVIFD